MGCAHVCALSAVMLQDTEHGAEVALKACLDHLRISNKVGLRHIPVCKSAVDLVLCRCGLVLKCILLQLLYTWS